MTRTSLACGLMTGLMTLWTVAAPLLAGELTPLPEVVLDELPLEARDQVERQRLQVEEVLAAPRRDDLELADAFGELAKLYYLYGFSDSSEIAWSNATMLAPNDARWPFYLGVLERVEGELESARRRFTRVLELRPGDVPALLLLAQIDLDEGRLEAAAGRFEQVREADSGSAAALYGLGRIAVAERRYGDAVELLERALAGQPEGSVIHHQLGLAYRGLGDLTKAGEHLERNRGVAVETPNPLMAELVPLVRGAHFKARLGIDALKAGDSALAVERLLEASRQDPESAWIRYNLAVAYQQSGDLEAARMQLVAALELEPDYSRAHFNLGALLATAGDATGAAQHFGRAYEIDPQDHAAHLELAVAMSRLGDEQRALVELRQLVGEAPQFIEARLTLATLLARMGRQQEALAVAQEILQLDASDSEWAAASSLAGRIVDRSDPAQAEAHYRRALELDPTAQEARLGLAMMLGRQQRFEAAAAEFESLVAAYPERPDYRIGQGMSLLLSEQYASAAAALEAAQALFPEQLEIAHLLARLLATCPNQEVRDGERALALAGAVLSAERTLEHAETLAMSLAEVGRFEDAIELQSQVVAQREQGGAGSEERLRRTLELDRSQRYLAAYRQGRAVRAPWVGGA